MSIVGISRIRFRSHDPVRFCRSHQTHLGSELKFLMRFALADAFNLRFMNGIKLLFVAFFLIEKAFAKVEQFLQFHVWGGHFPFDVPKNSAKKSFQLFRRFSRTLELIGFRITALAAQNLFPDSFVGLPQLNTVFTCGFYQTFTQSVVKSGIGWIADGFFLNGAVDIHPGQFRFLDEPFTQPRFQTFFEHFFCPAPGKFFAPTRHCRLIGRIFMLKINPSGKILPVRIFKPLIKNGFVTHAARVFQIMQRDHQANWTGGTTVIAQKLADKPSSKLCQSIASASLTIAWCGETISRNKGLNRSPCCSLRVSLFVSVLQVFVRFYTSFLQ